MAAAAVQVRVAANHAEVQVAKAILVVEDEPFVCEITCDVLSRQGYSVLWARNVGEATKIFYRHSGQIAVLLCDAILPDGNGFALVKAFRRQSPALKLIVASGYPPALLANAFRDGPGTRFLTKPYSSVTLMTAVKNLLREGTASEQVA